MKNCLFPLTLALALLAACDRPATTNNDEQRQADEKRIAELRDLEQRAAQRDADAKAAQNDLERQRLADAQAALDVEKQKLADERAAVQATAAQQAQWQADELRLAKKQAALQAQQAAEARTEREAPVAQPPPREPRDRSERTLDSFYSALDPLGDWMQVEPYGYCWQPREAQDPGWRPYVDGSWAYTNYGWTWKANEPFGWATYHYGRWARIKHTGWVWVPGSEWAPAWVSWRRSPEYVGWAALPPEAHSGSGFNGAVDSYYDIGPSSYNFVTSQRFGEPTYRGVLVEPERNVTIVNQTTNVTQINYTRIENQTAVFAGGPDLGQINAVSSRQVPRFTVERVNEPRNGSAAAVVAGGVLQMLAPHIASASRPTTTPMKVKEVVKAPQFERGWTGADPTAIQAMRAQAKQEAAQAEAQSRTAKQALIPNVPARAVPPAPARPVAPAAPLTVAPEPRASGPKPVAVDPDAARLATEKKAAAEAETARLAAEKKAATDRAAAARLEAQQKTMTDRAAAAQKLEDAQTTVDAKRKAIAEKRAADAKAREAAASVPTTPAPVVPPRERPMPVEAPPLASPGKFPERKLPSPKPLTEAPVRLAIPAKPLVDPKPKLDKKRAAEEPAKAPPSTPVDPTKQ